MARFDWRTPILLTHRWLGIVGGLLFITWFASGIVMMYARMPTLANEQRLAHAPVLDLSTATLGPVEAAGRAGVSADRVQAGMLLGRPVYRFGGRDQAIVFADNGDFFEGVDEAQAREIARRYVPDHTGAIRYDGYLLDRDQWTLQAGALLPIHRFALDDPAGTLLYVSEVTGDVVLRSTGRERFWAYLGPVVHWVYFTPFRSNGSLWSNFIIWSSLAGIVMCVSGLVWGLLRFSPFGRFRVQGARAASPYAGTMLWHHYAGLLFGAVTLTWTYSGLLSMEPFDWFSRPAPTRALRDASTGGDLRTEFLTLESLRAAAAVHGRSFAPREMEAVQVRGEPFWAADRPLGPDGAATWLEPALLPRAARPRMERAYVSAVAADRGARTSFSRETMREIADAAMPGIPVRDAVWLDEYDGYYYDPRGTRALPVLRVRYDDPAQTWLYLDPARGVIAQTSVSVSRLQRWLYQGLHSLDFPMIYFRRPLWDLVVVLLSLGGLVLSVTTLLPAWRRLRRHAGALGRLVTGRRKSLDPRAARAS